MPLLKSDAPTSSTASAALQPVTGHTGLVPYLRDAWRRRDFAIQLASADVRSNNTDTVLGNVWQLLNPTLLVAVYYLIFGIIFDVTRGVDNYLGFLVAGVFLFQFLRKSASSGARAVVNNRSLVQNIRFPRILLPVSVVLSEFFAFVPSLLVVYAVELATGEVVSWHWALIPLVAVLQLAFNLGLAMFTARATTHFRDMEQLLPFLLRLWFYMSGVLYPLSRVGDALGGVWQTLFEANPASVYIELGRSALLENAAPPVDWLVGLGWALASVVLGTIFFRQREMEYGDV